MAQMNITVPDKMKEWLDEHKEINRSELFRQAVKRKQDFMKGKVSSTVFFVTIIGIMMSITLIGIATRPYLMTEIRAIIALLGGILGFMTMMVYRKEKKEINASRSNA